MLKQFVITIALVSFLGAYTLAQEKPDTDKKEKKDCAKGCCSDHESNGKDVYKRQDLMVQGMLMRMPRGMILTSASDLTMLDPKTEWMYSLMFSINLPFAPWSVGKINYKEEELAAGISSIEQEKNDMQREMTSQLKEALVKYNTAKELTELYDKKVIPLYTSSSESQTTAYQNGKTNITAVIDSYRMLLMQKMNYYMSKADIQMSLAEVEMMVGANLKNLKLSEGNY